MDCIRLKLYKNIPIIIKAFQWFESIGPIESVVKYNLDAQTLNKTYFVETVNGAVPIKDEDYLIVDPDNNYYPVDKMLFESAYKELDENSRRRRNIMETYQSIVEQFTAFAENHEKFITAGNKAAAQRARKAIGEIKKLATQYRKESVAASKGE